MFDHMLLRRKPADALYADLVLSHEPIEILTILSELARRDADGQGERIFGYTKSMQRYTVAVTVMTAVNVAATLYVAFWK